MMGHFRSSALGGTLRIVTGIAVWAGLAFLVGRWIASSPDPQLSPVAEVARFVAGRPAVFRLRFQDLQLLRVGAPLFLGQDGRPPIGRITRLLGTTEEYPLLAWTDEAEAVLHGGWAAAVGVRDPGELALEWHGTPRSMAWVIQTMLPPEKRKEISAAILAALQEHQPEITSDLQPLFLEALSQSSQVIQNDLYAAIEVHREEFSRLAARYQVQILQQEIVPLTVNVLWPIVQEEAWPLVEEIGSEIWREASIWRLSWRYVYDSLPLPSRNLTRREFQRIVDEAVTPMILRRLPELYEAQTRIVRRISSHPEFQATLSRVLAMLARDEELHALGLKILREVITDNPGLAQVWADTWNRPEARQRLASLNEKLEPVIVGIGELLFGNPRTRITPEFSRVLRHKVLFKDEGWVRVSRRVEGARSTAASDGWLVVTTAAQPLPGPFHVPARPRQ